MAALAGTTGPQERAHRLSDASLATDDLTKVIWGDMQFQGQGIAVIANLTNLDGGRFINQRLSDILNQFTHLVTFFVASYYQSDHCSMFKVDHARTGWQICLS